MRRYFQMIASNNSGSYLRKRDIISFHTDSSAIVIHKEEGKHDTTITVHSYKASKIKYIDAIKVWWWIKWYAFKILLKKIIKQVKLWMRKIQS